MKTKLLNFFSALVLVFLLTSCKTKSKNKINPMKILDLGNKNFIGKILFSFPSPTDSRKGYVANNLEYKMVQITNTELIIFAIDKNGNLPDLQNPSNEPSLSNYLMTIKLKDIDLPCNDFLFLCTLGEFIREYKPKMPDINFTANKEVTNKLGETQALSNCLVITTGPFQSLDQLAYLCFNSYENLTFLQNLLTQRILALNSESYTTVTELINKRQDKLIKGVLSLGKYSLNFKTYYKANNMDLSIPYSELTSYAISLKNNFKLEWKGKQCIKPQPCRCFMITTKKNGNLTMCNYFARNDMNRKQVLTVSNSTFFMNILVAKLNMKIHNFNLENSQKSMLSLSSLECDSPLMESIKYEIRMKYLIARHKVKQIINLKRISLESGLKLIDGQKDKIISSSCASFEPCVSAAKRCIKSGVLPLKVKGYRLATTLQNPYITIAPKSSIKSDETRKLLKKSILKETKNLLKIKKTEDFYTLPTQISEIPMQTEIKKAFNTFSFIFNDRRKWIKKLEEVGCYCRHSARGSTHNLKTKVHYLLNSPTNDPLFDYLGAVRDSIFPSPQD